MERRTNTTTGSAALERSYLIALRAHVKTADGGTAGGRIGRRARSLGVDTLALARIHDRAAAALTPADASSNGVKSPRHGSLAAVAREESFFAAAIAPIEEAHGGGITAVSGSTRSAARAASLLGRRTAELAASRARSADGARLCAGLRSELEASERRHSALLRRSQMLVARLRRLSRRLLSAQEEERTQLSRDLHEAIGQTLTGISVGLASLKVGAAASARSVDDAILDTQRLVERSMTTVHRFAGDLRPTLLDDLGVVPALRSCTRTFGERTGVRARFAADRSAEGVDAARATALFRVAQAALQNVEQHARASRVRVSLRTLGRAVRLEVTDDGRSFDALRAERSKSSSHVGLLAMRERVEMVGGTFSVASSPGRGTTVRADVPLVEVVHG